jgi:molybdate transport system substrate-binding protein
MRRHLALLILAALAGACAISGRNDPASGPAPGELIVFAAASLAAPFEAIGEAFGRANGGATVTFNFGGSQQLAQQIANGAPADVFASANQKQIDVVVEAGRVEPHAARTFARNRLVVVAPRDNPGRVATLADLSRPGLKLVLAARDVPAGQYALEMLEKAERDAGAGFKDAVLANVVSYEHDVKAVLTKVVLGEADAGVVYASDVSREARDRVTRVDIPDPVNALASYPVAVVSGSRRAELAARFVEYLGSPAAQSVLAEHGFIATTAALVGGDEEDPR